MHLVQKFPKWNPTKRVKRILDDSMDNKLRFKVFRGSCSAFISNPLVRHIISKRDQYECQICHSKNNLHIDHIKSVHYCFKINDLYSCNQEYNLQLLCRKCNTSKKP